MFSQAQSQWWELPSRLEFPVSGSSCTPEPIIGDPSLPTDDDMVQFTELPLRKEGSIATSMKQNREHQRFQELQPGLVIGI